MFTPTKDSTATSAPQQADNPPLSPDHLNHPERWATGADQATGKQISFIEVLEKQKGLDVGEERKEKMGKSEASEVIDGLKHGKVIPQEEVEAPGAAAPPAPKRKRDDQETAPASTTTTSSSTTDSTTEASEPKSGESETKAEEPAPADAEADAKTDEDASPADADSAKATTPAVNGDANEKGEPTTSAPPTKKVKTDAEAAPKDPSTADAPKEVPNLPSTETPADDHLAHPETWATGDEPATEKQLGYLAVLEKKNGDGAVSNHDGMGKSEASEKIAELK